MPAGSNSFSASFFLSMVPLSVMLHSWTRTWSLHTVALGSLKLLLSDPAVDVGPPLRVRTPGESALCPSAPPARDLCRDRSRPGAGIAHCLEFFCVRAAINNFFFNDGRRLTFSKSPFREAANCRA